MSISVGPPLQVVDVRVEPPGDRLRANLESPISGAAPRGMWLPLAGWALAAGDEDVQIEISHGRYALARLPRQVLRRDVAAAFPGVPGAERSGFSCALGVAQLPQQFELCIAGAMGPETIPFAHVSGVRRPFTPVEELSIAPLALTTLGRSGSTLLCALLACHPEIAAFRPAGYDSRPFAYWLEATTALSAPASRLALLDSAVSAGQWWLGREHVLVESLHCLEEPVREVLLDDQLDDLLGMGVAAAAAFAHRIALAEGKEAARYAAEKCSPGYIPRLLHELSPQTREIVLVRDFRDVLASMLAFNAKRGYPAFGRESVATDEEFVRRLASDAQALAEAWRERREQCLLIRYEELIAAPELVLAELFSYLGLDSDAGQIAAIIATAEVLLQSTARGHRTSAGASSGRWRSDLPESLMQACEPAFAGALEEFGYA